MDYSIKLSKDHSMHDFSMTHKITIYSVVSVNENEDELLNL